MRWTLLILLLCIFSFGGVYYLTTHEQFFVRYSSTYANDHDGLEEDIHVLITVCNSDRIEDHRTMQRYREVAGLLTTIQRYGMTNVDERIIVHIFADDPATLNEQFLQALPTSKLIDRLDSRVYAIPTAESRDHDYNKYLHCASTRLYAPHLFRVALGDSGDESNIPERVIYLDTDTLVTTPLRKLWQSSTAAFNEHPNALFAMAQECLLRPEMGEFYHTGYTGQNVTDLDGDVHFIYALPNGTCQGYNSGVLFANLHRWQRNNFSDIVSEQESYAKRFNFHMLFGDQGIFNMISARYPEYHLELPCFWNMRIDTWTSCFSHYVNNGGGILHMQSKHRDAFYHNQSLATTLRSYLIRVNDTGVDYGIISKYYDRNNPDNTVTAQILEGLIFNNTKSKDAA